MNSFEVGMLVLTSIVTLSAMLTAFVAVIRYIKGEQNMNIYTVESADSLKAMEMNIEITVPFSTIEKLVWERSEVGPLKGNKGIIVLHKNHVIYFTLRELQGIYFHYYTHCDGDDPVIIKLKSLEIDELNIIKSYDAFVWDYNNNCPIFLYPHKNIKGE